MRKNIKKNGTLQVCFSTHTQRNHPKGYIFTFVIWLLK